MNKAKVIISIFIFYGFISFIAMQIGAEQQIPSMPTEIMEDNQIPYNDILNDSQKADANVFHLNEYHWSSDIEFQNVYQLNRAVKTDSMFRKIPVWKDPTTWGNIFKKIKWKYGSMDNMTHGDDIYLYPFIRFHYGKWYHPNLWLVVGCFDAYSSAPQEWTNISKIDFMGMDTLSCDFEFITRLHLGTMGYYDKYYIIDVIRTDVDLQGLSISDIIDYLIPSGKAQVVERYGGVIYGELHKDQPTTLAYHELSLQKQYGSGMIGTIRHMLDNWNNGMKFLTQNNPLASLIELLIISPIALMFGWIIYTEARSWIPFLRGGE